MSTLNIGKTCAECLQDGRCLATCYTQGGGYYVASGLTATDGRTIVTTARMPPNNVPGVAVVMCGGPQTVVAVFASGTARHLARFITEKAEEAER